MIFTGSLYFWAWLNIQQVAYNFKSYFAKCQLFDRIISNEQYQLFANTELLINETIVE
jgi:hypothetical protein